MAVPQPPLVVGQGLEHPFADDVLDADQLGGREIGVIDHALVEVLVQVRAVVVGLDLPAHIVGIEMETVEIGAHRIEWPLDLDRVRV